MKYHIEDIATIVKGKLLQHKENGLVEQLLTDSRKIISGPEVITKGLVGEELEAQYVEKAKKVVRGVIADYESDVRDGKYNMDLQEEIRVELRRFFNQMIGKKPVVLPIILDL